MIKQTHGSTDTWLKFSKDDSRCRPIKLIQELLKGEKVPVKASGIQLQASRLDIKGEDIFSL
jgi:hypothetical protein